MSYGHPVRQSMNHEVEVIEVMRLGSERNLVTMEEFEKRVNAKRCEHAKFGVIPNDELNKQVKNANPYILPKYRIPAGVVSESGYHKGVNTRSMTYDEWDRLLENTDSLDMLRGRVNLSLDELDQLQERINFNEQMYKLKRDMYNRCVGIPTEPCVDREAYITAIKDAIYVLVWIMCGCMAWYLIMQNHPMLGLLQLCIFMMMVSKK